MISARMPPPSGVGMKRRSTFDKIEHLCYNMIMHNTGCLVIKIVPPNRAKRQWLERTESSFAQAVQIGLDAARAERTSSRARLHSLAYRQARDLGLPADYARMAVNAAVSLARSYYGQRRSRHFKRVSFPKVNGSQGIGLGVNAYKLVKGDSRWVLRVSTGVRGRYVWLPLCVPAKYTDRMTCVRGDARLFRRGGDWYAALAIRISPTPTGCSGKHTFLGVDLGIVRHAVVATPDRVVIFDGKADRWRREHFADLRRRYQRHRRTDRVRASQGKEARWMRDINHKISRQIVELALEYPNPVIVLERLDGIRYRTRGSKRFNRMMSSWAFRQLVDMIRYKAAKAGVLVAFCDPRGTSKTCPQCGHASRANRRKQELFRCVRCGYQANADVVAARNIAAAGPGALRHGRPDTARPSSEGQTGDVGLRPDGVKECASVHSDPNLASPVSGTPRL